MSDRAHGPGGGAGVDDAPILILIDETTAQPAITPDTPLLGLTLIRRAVLAARRAGYAWTLLLARAPGPGHDGSASDGVVGRGDGRDLETLTDTGARRLVIAPALVLAEGPWLVAAARQAIPRAGWAGVAGRIAIIDAAAVPTALDGLRHVRRHPDFEAVERHLTNRLGAPAQAVDATDIMLVNQPEDLPRARRRLLRSLVKESDGFMARHVERPISIALSRWLAETAVTPNRMTVASVAVGVAGAPFFISASPFWQTIGALLFLAHSILDGCDGELARLKFKESRWGGLLDFWSDNIVHLAIFSGMALGWTRATGAAWPLAIGALAVLGAGGSAAFVYWRMLRGKSGEGPLFTSVTSERPEALARLLDGASRRDFIYLVLILALFGKSSWFLVLAGIGAPVYLLLLVIVAWRERPHARAT